MAPIKPMLDEIELQLVQKVDTEQDQTLVQHPVPGLEGDFLQRLGRRASRITLSGVMTGPDSGDSLKSLREKFRAAVPVSFVSDIATATKVNSVMIEEMAVRELAGKPQRFAYSITLRELLPAPPPRNEDPPVPPPIDPIDPIDPVVGTLEVEVIVEGDPDFDFGRVVITLEGTNADNTTFSRALTSRSNNIWTEPNLRPGGYTVRAATLDPEPLTDTGTGQVQGGQTTRVTLTIRVSSPVATTFLISFRFDKAFIEPCEREVLRQVVAFSDANPGQKLLITGHTDEVDTNAYNQSLSERRARSVYAFLTAGRDPIASFNEWNALRLTRPRSVRRGVRDNWGLRQAQHMLQDLGFYPGDVDGKDGPLTQEAVRAFRCQKGLPPGTNIDDDVWEALIKDYQAQDAFNIPADRFFTNCPGEIVKWVGCGEEDPVRRTGNPFRRSRRVEMLFVRTSSLPCRVPQPDTFDEPETGRVNAGGWCVGPGAATAHGCFVTPNLIPNTNNAQPCSTSPTGPWCRQPAEPGTLNVQGSIMFENGTPARSQLFYIIAPDGEFLPGESGNGEPQIGQTDSNGAFTFSNKVKGIYSLTVLSRPNQPAFLVRLDTQQDADIKGNVVCKALHSDSDHLDAVIIDAPAIREIRLPAAVHLMTALHPLTRATRTCPSTVGPPAPQVTAHSAADVSGFIEAANRIWRPARVRLRLAAADIVQEAYAFRTECEVDSNEFILILEKCAYPNTVNFFFFGDLSGNSEAGMFVLAPVTGPRRTVDGCAISDRFQFTVFTPPVDVPLDTAMSEQVVAHEFGHFLGLAPVNHVPNTPANSNRLMLPGTRDGSNRTLTPDEVAQARASDNAGLDCLPLTLRVTGATRIGGARSHEFMVLQNTTGGTVTVDAVINPRLLDPTVGALDLQGGAPGANPLQRTVSIGTTGTTEIVGTYTPASGSNPVITHVSISVVTFRLRMDGACQTGGTASNTFIDVQSADPNALVTVIAEINPAPFCVPRDLVNWSAGTETTDPLRRTVPLSASGTTTINATFLGTTTTATLSVVTFRLRVDGQRTQLGGPTGTSFVTTRDNTAVLTVVAEISPLPSPVPADLVTWTGITTGPDPLRQTVSRATVLRRTINATVCRTTLTVVIDILAGALTTNVAPFNTPVNPVQIEGVLDANLTSIDLTDLIGTQRSSLFRARAEVPAIVGNTLSVDLVSVSAAGEVERLPINLTRSTGDLFTSRPILTIPIALPRAGITTVDMEVIRAQAGNNIQLQASAALGSLRLAQTLVRGRVVHIFAQNFTGSGATVAFIQGLIDKANRVWAQAGVEVKARSIIDAVAPPAGLLDLDTFASRNPFTGDLTDEEKQLLRISANGPARSPTANDMNIYFVRALIDPNPALPNPNLGAVAYATESYSSITEPDHSAIALEGTGLASPFLGHELGHHLLRNWVSANSDEHSDTQSPQVPWPLTNVMSSVVAEVSIVVDRTQVQNLLDGTATNTHPVIRFEPF